MTRLFTTFVASPTRRAATSAACCDSAAFATVPLVVMAIYLALARRTGAFEAL